VVTTTTDETCEVDGVLWVGALLYACGRLDDPFPPLLDDVATLYFGLVAPRAKA
jgi:hypothetical protein